MSKRFLIIMAVLIIGFFGIIIFNNQKDESNNNGNASNTSGSNHVEGAGTKGVTLVEFGDFECPACAQYYPLTKQIKEKYGDQIKLQFRHFPLVQIHENAMVAHRASEAAGRQGKFWQMHDLLYERQSAWQDSKNPTAIMEDYATELGLNIDQYKADFSSPEVNDVIAADMKLGQEIGANSTPTFVLNGKKIEPLPQDIDGFYKLIDEAIANQN